MRESERERQETKREEKVRDKQREGERGKVGRGRIWEMQGERCPSDVRGERLRRTTFCELLE